jgi:peptide/nickel transport system substrate-binding protein
VGCRETPPDRLVATFRSEPTTFNRFVGAGAAEDLFARLTQAPLIRLNRVTGEIEPWLATGWTQSSPDGRVWTFALRQGVTFSDGVPFTAADVEFTFQALYDRRVESELASSLLVADQPLSVRATDDHTVVVTFPAPYGPGLSLFDALPILPKHKLQAALDAGTFRQAWGLGTPLTELVGLGPFVLREYQPGQRLLFARNPHYWRKDEQGGRLPRLDELEVQIVPDQNAELLRLQAGTVDLTTAQVRPEDLALLRPLEARGTLRLVQAGVSIDADGLWFNLAPDAPDAKARPWLQREELRHAISLAVDRQAFANTVFLGEAKPIYGPITPGNRAWFLADLPEAAPDLARAKALLASIGLIDRHHTGMLEDASGHPARFSILTQKGHTILERSVAVLREQLARVGLTVDIVTLENRAMLEALQKGQYEAMYFYVIADSFDPARSPDFWMSSGDFHLWQFHEKTPARPWEATIDDLMRRESTTVDVAEQRRLFAEVQRTFVQHEPIVYFAAPIVTVAMSSRVQGATPSVLLPTVLWNPDVLSVKPAGASRQ